jgi:hypothetical protein
MARGDWLNAHPQELSAVTNRCVSRAQIHVALPLSVIPAEAGTH